MAQGNWVIMFPEGTRTPRGSQGTYKTGGTRLAVATGAPVRADRGDLGALLAAQELRAAAGRDRRLDRRADPVDGREPDELMREVETWIEAEMRRLDPEAYHAPKERCPKLRGARILREVSAAPLGARPGAACLTPRRRLSLNFAHAPARCRAAEACGAAPRRRPAAEAPSLPPASPAQPPAPTLVATPPGAPRHPAAGSPRGL